MTNTFDPDRGQDNSIHRDSWLDELVILSDDNGKLTDKQIRILQAAVEMFSEKGYAATSTSEIAGRAGVAEGTIFRHYKTKKELLISIVSPLIPKLVAPFVMRDFSPVLHTNYDHVEDFLRAVLENRLGFVKKYMSIIRIVLQEVPFHPELQAQFKRHVAPKVLARIQEIIEAFQRRGEIIDIPPLSVMRMSASVMLGYVLARFFIAPEHHWNEEEEIEQMIGFISRGLRPV